jgi:hypothetical protein
VALDELLGTRYRVVRQTGAHQSWGHETLTFGSLVADEPQPVVAGPLHYEDIDVGEVLPARCLSIGLWLCLDEDGAPFALLISPHKEYGRLAGVHLEIAVVPGDAGNALTQRFLGELESRIAAAGSYRGKVLSLEGDSRYSGRSGGIRVHKLRTVPRDEIILADRTLALLDRNLMDFARRRDALRGLGMSAKKGLLFYGPPGTGKTHTIHYLAGQLPGHTTLLITAEQVALLAEYMQLARFLQPAVVVFEDVDLIARARETMHSPCEESLLNRLLNEMDGLREDAAIFFILTTNRPDQLEAALASRPGRVDQAIEFPLPDAPLRRRLVRLYARGLPLSDEVVEAIVARTDRASAAFIKELLRRAAQFHLEARDGETAGADGATLTLPRLEAALEEMLFAGGSLNVKVIGGAGTGEG